MYPFGEKRFLLINKISIIALFLLILAGGIVRSSDSGMGCPDWPECFGCMIPPTNISQLPAGYQEKYVQKRIEKNERFAKTLERLGYDDLAGKIRQDKSILNPEAFNASKTWTEYINRLIGALTGFFLIGCSIFSFRYLKTRKRIFFLSLLNVLLVGFQGWLGSLVVSTNLLAWIVTVHMMIALLILAICIYTLFQASALRDSRFENSGDQGLIKITAIFALMIIIVQIAIGTEIREQIDNISSSMVNLGRSEWVSKLGSDFDLHKNLALLILITSVTLFYLGRKKALNKDQGLYIGYVLGIVFFQVITGVSLSYLALPAVAQALHVLLASLLFGAQFYLVLLMQKNNFTIKT